MTGERRETTSSIFSNGSDEDLSIVSSDPRTRTQSQVDCMETAQARHIQSVDIMSPLNLKNFSGENC